MTRDKIIEKIIGYGYYAVNEENDYIAFKKTYVGHYGNNIKTELDVYFDNVGVFEDYCWEFDCSEINPIDIIDLKVCAEVFDNANRECSKIESELYALL